LDGKFLIEPQFEAVRSFSEGLAAIQKNGTWDYIDHSGKVVAKGFTSAEDFHGGIARVRKNDIWCYIDVKGRALAAPLYGACDFSEGTCRIRIGGKIGYVNRELMTVIPAKFDDGTNFSDGLAATKIGDRWGYIDSTGKTVIPHQFVKANGFHDGVAVVGIGSDIKKGFINKAGRMIIEPKFAFAFDFSEGLAPVVSGGRWIRCSYEHSGLAFERGRWGYIDQSGKLIIVLAPDVEHAEGFSNGVAQVRLKDGREGYVDKRGDYLWKPSK
jgi:hypothetical protein